MVHRHAYDRCTFQPLVLVSALKILTERHSGTETHLLLSRLPPQGEDPQADGMLTYAPASRAEHPEGRPLQTLSQVQPQELGLKGDGRVQKRTLIGKLIAYLAMMPASPTKAGPLTPYELMRMPWRISRKRLSPTEDASDLPGPGDGKPASLPPGVSVVDSDSTCFSSTGPGAGRTPGTCENRQEGGHVSARWTQQLGLGGVAPQ